MAIPCWLADLWQEEEENYNQIGSFQINTDLDT